MCLTSNKPSFVKWKHEQKNPEWIMHYSTVGVLVKDAPGNGNVFPVAAHIRISRETLTLIVGIERKTREEEEKVRKSKCCSGGRGL